MTDPAPVPRAGCLTDAEIAVLQKAPPGRAPDALALHLASCSRCQQRALFGNAPRRAGRRRSAAAAPSVRRTVVLVLIAIGAIAVFFWSLQHLAGQAR